MKKVLLILFAIITITTNAQCWESIATGHDHTIALKSDGTIWTWGSNAEGQLGTGITQNESTPVQVGSANTWAWVAVGGYYSIAIKNDGTLWAWGANESGQLGNGTNTASAVPLQIGTDTNWATVTSGESHTLAVKTNGTLWAWGLNQNNQLGDTTIINRVIPLQIGTATNWRTVSAGTFHSAAIKTDGTLWTWGNNNWGQLGTASYGIYQFSFPVQISIETNWQSLSLSQENTIAFKADGTIWVCGTNYDAGLTNIGQGNSWQAAICSAQNIYAIDQDGGLWAAGSNALGQMGIDWQPEITELVPVNNDTNWQFISSKLSSVAGIKTDGTLSMWGLNDHGQLANPSIDNYSASPTQVSCTTAGLGTPLAQNVVLYPNPVKDILYIDAKGLAINTILITDVTGKTIISQNNASQINVQQLPAGMYFVKIISGQNTYQDKFIKQ